MCVRGCGPVRTGEIVAAEEEMITSAVALWAGPGGIAINHISHQDHQMDPSKVRECLLAKAKLI